MDPYLTLLTICPYPRRLCLVRQRTACLLNLVLHDTWERLNDPCNQARARQSCCTNGKSAPSRPCLFTFLPRGGRRLPHTFPSERGVGCLACLRCVLIPPLFLESLCVTVLTAFWRVWKKLFLLDPISFIPPFFSFPGTSEFPGAVLRTPPPSQKTDTSTAKFRPFGPFAKRAKSVLLTVQGVHSMVRSRSCYRQTGHARIPAAGSPALVNRTRLGRLGLGVF